MKAPCTVLPSIFALLSTLVAGCAAREPIDARKDGGPASSVTAERALRGTAYERGRDLVQRHCAGCHSQNGEDPRQRVAYPAFHVDAYDDWVSSRTILLAVLDKWNPDGDVMPPPDAVELSDDDRRTLLDWIRRGSPNTVDGQ